MATDTVKVVVVSGNEGDVLTKLGAALGVDLKAQITAALGAAGVAGVAFPECADCGACEDCEPENFNENFGAVTLEDDNSSRTKVVFDVAEATEVTAVEGEDSVTVTAVGANGEEFEDTVYFNDEDGTYTPDHASVYWNKDEGKATVRIYKRRVTGLKAGRQITIK